MYKNAAAENGREEDDPSVRGSVSRTKIEAKELRCGVSCLFRVFLEGFVVVSDRTKEMDTNRRKEVERRRET